MDNIQEFLDQYITEDLIHATLSGCRSHPGYKLRIRPVEIRGEVCFQTSLTDGIKVFHKNYNRDQILEYLGQEVHTYSQLQAETGQAMGTLLISKHGKVTIRTKRKKKEEKVRIEGHNRQKKYIIHEGKPVPFLVELGVMNDQGRVIRSKYDKFRQINRFLEYIRDILPSLPRDRTLTVLDFGCGKSYLTFAIYYYLHELLNFSVRIIGLDLKEDVIENCTELARRFEYKDLTFLTGDIADYEGVDSVDLVVTLHACDTATDYALYKAVKWKAGAILSVPCCQHELNGQIHNELLDTFLSYGILKERMSALITDGIRARLLESRGYDVQLLEFIDMEHTPKNILIRATLRADHGDSASDRQNKRQALDNIISELHVSPTLATLFSEAENIREEGEVL